MDLAALRTEITTDPASLGYAALVASGNDQGVADAANRLTGPGAATITLATRAKNDFLTLTAAACVRLAVGVGTDGNPIAAATIAKWNAALSQARSADPGSAINLGVITQLGDPVADKIMSQAEYTALTTRTGSRMEVLFGANTTIGQADVSRALRGQG